MLKLVVSRREQAAPASCAEHEQLLREIACHDWRGGGQAPSAHLRQLAKQAILEIENHPQDYLTALSEATAAEKESASERPPGLTAEAVLQKIAVDVSHKVIEELLIKATPWDCAPRLKECYEDLQSIYRGNYSLARKLDQIGVVLSRAGQLLGSVQGLPEGQVRSLTSYLGAVGRWLTVASQQWAALENISWELSKQSSISGQVLTLLEAASTLLNEPQVRGLLGKNTLDSVAGSVDMLKQTLRQLQLLQQLPSGSDFSDVLKGFTCNPQITKVLGPSLAQFQRALEQADKASPFPTGGDLTEQFSWLMKGLSRPESRELVRPHLEMMSGDPVRTAQLLDTIEFANRLGQCPPDLSLAQQAQWLLGALDSSSPTAAATGQLPWVRHLRSALAVAPGMADFVNRLLTINPSRESWPAVLRDICRITAPSLALPALEGAALCYLPADVVLGFDAFCRQSATEKSWTSWFEHAACSALDVAKPYVASSLMGDPLAATTVRFAEFGQHVLNPEGLLQGVAVFDKAKSEHMRSAYRLYLNATLAWRIYRAFDNDNAEQSESDLRRLARELKDLKDVRQHPHLEHLIDLLPLLPALREANRAVGAQPSASSWLNWGQQWLDALANSGSESLIALRAALSRCMTIWLAAALMSAFDSLARQPWNVLPGAEAASLCAPEAGEQASAPGAASRSAVDWRLMAGVGLEVLGLAVLCYALWRMYSGESKRRPEPKELNEILLPALEPADTGERLPVPASASAPAGNMVSAAWDQKVPLLFAMAAMSAGGYLIYDWSRQSDEVARKVDEIIEQLDVANIDFLFYHSIFIEEENQIGSAEKEKSSRGTESNATKAGGASQTGLPSFEKDWSVNHRTRRGLRSGDAAGGEDLWAQVDLVLQRQEMSVMVRAELKKLFEKAAEAKEVKNAVPAKARNIRRLIKTRELIDAFINYGESVPYLEEVVESAVKISRELIALSEAQTDPLLKMAIDRYEKSFSRPLNPVEKAEASSRFRQDMERFNQRLDDDFYSVAELSLARVARLYSPIMSPASYIDDYIRKGVEAYERETKRKTGLTPDSKMRMKFVQQRTIDYRPSGEKEINTEYSLRDLVTYSYRYDVADWEKKYGVPYKEAEIQHADLVKFLRKKDLQSIMQGEIKNYSENFENRSNLKSFYREMINLRCIEYLASHAAVPAYAEAVRDFLEGKVQAKAVSFRGTAMDGVFLIPVGEAGGLVLCVDEKKHFHFGTDSREFLSTGVWGKIMDHPLEWHPLPAFPDTKEFRAWVLGKLPIYEYLKNKDNPDVCKYTFAFASGSVKERIFTYGDSLDKEQLVDQLYECLMARLTSDVDTLIYSPGEQRTVKALEILKQLLTVASVGMILAPGTSTILGYVSRLMASLAMDGLEVAASLAQANLVDRPDLASEYFNEAIVGGAFGIFGGILDSGALASKVVNTVYSKNNIALAIIQYRRVSEMVYEKTAVLLKRLKWIARDDSSKMDELVKAAMSTDEAGELRHMMTSADPTIIRRAIRNNLELEFDGQPRRHFLWSDFETERENARVRLKADAGRLRMVDDHMKLLPDFLASAPSLASGASEKKVVEWVSGGLWSRKEFEQEQILIMHLLVEYLDEPLVDLRTVRRIHNALNLRAADAPRGFRPSSVPEAIGSDIALPAFHSALLEIRRRSDVTIQPYLLYAAIMNYRPFVHDNSRTARMLYALLSRKNNMRFSILSEQAETALAVPRCGLGQLFFSTGGEMLQRAENFSYLGRNRIFYVIDEFQHDGKTMVVAKTSVEQGYVHTVYPKDSGPVGARSPVLVITAHGIHYPHDVPDSASASPFPGESIKFYNPAGTLLLDFGLNNVVNFKDKVHPYVVITSRDARMNIEQRGAVPGVWKASGNRASLTGIMNQRYITFSKDTDEKIAKILQANYVNSIEQKVDRVDIFSVKKTERSTLHGIRYELGSENSYSEIRVVACRSFEKAHGIVGALPEDIKDEIYSLVKHLKKDEVYKITWEGEGFEFDVKTMNREDFDELVQMHDAAEKAKLHDDVICVYCALLDYDARSNKPISKRAADNVWASAVPIYGIDEMIVYRSESRGYATLVTGFYVGRDAANLIYVPYSSSLKFGIVVGQDDVSLENDVFG
ncbi:hypothetical protein MyNCGM683_40420 [Achromobacter xylosoxidans]